MIRPAFSVLADKPLKKRKQDSYPQESETMDGAAVQGINTDSSLTPKKTIPASNGGTRPALMVSIDLEKAGRLIGQPVVVLDSKSLCEDHRQHVKSDGKADRAPADNRTESGKQHADNPRRAASDGQAESPRVSQERQSDTKKRQDGRVDNDRGHGENKRPDAAARPKHNRHSDKNHDGHQPHVSQPETAKSASKADGVSKHGEDKVRERNKDADRHQNKDRDRIKDREVVKDRDRVVEKERHKDKDRNEHKNTDKDRDKNKVLDKNRNREGRERSKNLEMDKEISRSVEIDRVKDKQVDKARERNKNTEIEKCKDKKRDKEIDKERERSKNTDVDKGKDRNADKETDKSRERNKNTDPEKDTDRNRDKETDRDRNRDKDRNKDKDRDPDRTRNKDRDKERSRDKDRDRERKLQTARENSHRQSPDRHDKVDGSTGKPERSRKPTDGQSRPRTENPGVEGGHGRDAGVSCPAKSKETKAVEFPAYLLGGKSGSLKNFVIPKLSRDGRDAAPLPSKLKGGWVEPLVRLERVSLVESLKNKASPTVTLQRLSADEVRRIIKDGREAQRSRPRKWSNSNKPGRGGAALFTSIFVNNHSGFEILVTQPYVL